MKRYLFLLLCFSLVVFSQSELAQSGGKNRKTASRTPEIVAEPVPNKPVVSVTENKEQVAAPQTGKKNQRDASTQNGNSKTNNEPQKTAAKMPYAYEFSQPDFVVNHVLIEHDDNGKGAITFEKRKLGEPITDPIQIAPDALERIKKLWGELDFLNSTEVYQSAKYDYPHLGRMKLRMEADGKKREVELNWTENKTAESLTKEYKRLTEHYIWIFDINLARENQPLEAPKLMEKLDSLIKRGEIYDVALLLPVLRETKDDERIPLIARNHAERIIKTIEKMSEKKK
ncbi:MAG: hypothetical protein M3209_01350 [Acidobacteriota bacterium]|nr:hypothetical protein [Acidobacteriota bacterium]